jgi:diguanylate cyclase (GGDEF)-like protein
LPEGLEPSSLVGRLDDGEPSGETDRLVSRERGASFFVGLDGELSGNSRRRGELYFSEFLAAFLAMSAVAITALGYLIGTLVLAPVPVACQILFGIAGVLGIRVAHRRASEVSDLAYDDELTGLPNRRFFVERLWTLLSEYRRGPLRPALLLLDLDRFKVINDTMGHPAGDRLLKEVADRLRAHKRRGDVLARLGGDEFALLAVVESAAEAEELAETLLGGLNRPVNLSGQTIWPNASIGIALPGTLRPSPQDLMSMADVALYQAKANGKGQCFLYEPHAPLPSTHRLSLESDLRTAVEQGQFDMVYQPLVNLETMSIEGVEALLRWNHPTLGELRPDSFLPLADETGLWRGINKWVLTETCAQASTWHGIFGQRFSVGINLSARQFRDMNFITELNQVLKKTGATSDFIHFEITESALMEDEEDTLRNLDGLRQLGFQVAIDDFGVGYSSLSYLRRFKVDIVKVDQSFVRDRDPGRTLPIVRTVVQLANALGMTTTAEGIETEAQLQLIREAGCNLGQGFLLSTPMSAVQITQMLAGGPIPLPEFATARQEARDRLNRASVRNRLHA